MRDNRSRAPGATDRRARSPRSRIDALDGFERHARKAHVLRDRQIRHDRRILVDGDDAGAARLGGRAKGHDLSGDRAFRRHPPGTRR